MKPLTECKQCGSPMAVHTTCSQCGWAWKAAGERVLENCLECGIPLNTFEEEQVGRCKSCEPELSEDA